LNTGEPSALGALPRVGRRAYATPVRCSFDARGKEGEGSSKARFSERPADARVSGANERS
jgi:hypothetical protein